MAGKYDILYDDLRAQHDNILAYYEQARERMSAQSFPTTAYMDLKWDRDANQIIYIPTMGDISAESQQTRYKVYYQLDQLFALSTRNQIYA